MASHRSKSFKRYYAYLNNLVSVGDPTEEDEFLPLDNKSPRQVLSSNKKSKKVLLTIITTVGFYILRVNFVPNSILLVLNVMNIVYSGLRLRMLEG